MYVCMYVCIAITCEANEIYHIFVCALGDDSSNVQL
jgi:hypothetical protein